MSNTSSTTTNFKHGLLNVCVLVFVAIVTVVGLVAFFVATFQNENTGAYSIVSLYVLCMLLAAPTLKVFMDKIECPIMKKLNISGVILIFVSILVMTVTTFVDLAFGF